MLAEHREQGVSLEAVLCLAGKLAFLILCGTAPWILILWAVSIF